MDTKHLELKLLNQSHWDELISFYHGYLDRNNTIQDWLYPLNPQGVYLLYGVFLNNSIVGTLGLMPVTFVKGDKEIITYKMEDGYVPTKHRGQGIYKMLTEKLIENNQNLIWGFTSNPHIFNIKGFNIDARISNAYYNKVNWIKLWKNSINIKKKIALSAISLLPKSIKTPQNISIKEGFSDDVNDFYQQVVKNASHFIPKLDEQIFHWQYESNPFFHKSFCLSIQKNGITKCISLATIEDEIAFINATYFDKNTTDKEKAQYIKCLSNYLLKKNVYAVKVWHTSFTQSGKNIQKYYQSAGFKILNKGMYFGNNLPTANLEMNDFHFTGQIKIID